MNEARRESELHYTGLLLIRKQDAEKSDQFLVENRLFLSELWNYYFIPFAAQFLTVLLNSTSDFLQ